MPTLEDVDPVKEGLALQKRFDEMGDTEDKETEPQYDSDQENQIDRGDGEDGRSVVSYRSKYSNALKVGREDLQSATRLLRAKKVKGNASKSAANTKAAILASGRAKLPKFI